MVGRFVVLGVKGQEPALADKSMKSTLKIRPRPDSYREHQPCLAGRQEFLIKDSIACPGFNRDGR